MMLSPTHREQHSEGVYHSSKLFPKAVPTLEIGNREQPLNGGCFQLVPAKSCSQLGTALGNSPDNDSTLTGWAVCKTALPGDDDVKNYSTADHADWLADLRSAL